MSATERPVIGRPRAFDPGQALDRALEVFWRQGYEGASLADLTAAMGINRTSMYTAFGTKEDLFRLALARYTSGPASYVEKALHQPTARAVAEAVMDGAVTATTSPGGPAGCLGVQGALATGSPGEPARAALAQWRASGEDAIRERFTRARDEGDLPPHADPAVLARYITTLAYGISVQAATGASREALAQLAGIALAGWPTGTRPRRNRKAEPRAARNPAPDYRPTVLSQAAVPDLDESCPSGTLISSESPRPTGASSLRMASSSVIRWLAASRRRLARRSQSSGVGACRGGRNASAWRISSIDSPTRWDALIIATRHRTSEKNRRWFPAVLSLGRRPWSSYQRTADGAMPIRRATWPTVRPLACQSSPPTRRP